MDVASYIGDARARMLPLLGEVTGQDASGFHDWAHLLEWLGWLETDRGIALAVHALGVFLMISALAWGAAALWVQVRNLAPTP